MQIELTKGDFGSQLAHIARLKLVNAYVVENPLSVSGVSYLRRPSVSAVREIGPDLSRGIWSQNKNGKTYLYLVSGTKLYTYTPSTNVFVYLGVVEGSSLCQFAASIFHTAILSDGRLYLTDGEVLTLVDIPDNLVPTSVTSLDNYFIISVENETKLFYILPGETVIDPLSFFSAERNPDDVKAIKAVGDELWALGTDTTELFTDSGDVNAPFIRLAGRVYDIGCADPKSVVRATKNSLPCLIWVSSSKEVILAQGVPTKISNVSVEELLKAANNFYAWSFRTAKHDFYTLTTENVTLVYDLTTDLWSRWSSYQKPTWSAHAGVQIDDTIYSIAIDTNTLDIFGNKSVDYTNSYISCEIGGFVPNPTSSPIACNKLSLLMNFGYSSLYTYIPLIEARWSDDGGASWTTYLQGSLGAAGEYPSDVLFRSLGQINRPGRYFEFRFTDVQDFRLDGASMNE
jgi:hypothetical protein